MLDIQERLTDFHGNEAKRKYFFEKQNLKWPTQKKCVFQNRQFSILFCENFMDRLSHINVHCIIQSY